MQSKVLLVDPAYFWFGAPHKKFTVLDDLQTVAVYLAERGELQDNQIAAKLDPASSFVQGNLTAMLMDSDQWEEARQSLTNYLRSSSDEAFCDYLEANLALHEHRTSAAVGLLHESVRVNADFAQAHLLLAATLEEQGNLRAARESFRRALESTLDRTNEEAARHAIAQINEKLGDERE